MPIIDDQIVDQYYHALLNKDANAVTDFYAGVDTTSIFCIATCTAKKPLKENVTFFKTLKEVLDLGYRPCKICKPIIGASETPKEVKQAIEVLYQNPKEKITDYQLHLTGINPDVLRRWFKTKHDITFHTYQRMFRINNGILELRSQSKNKDNTAEYGLGYTFKRKKSASSSELGINKIYISRMKTPLGSMFLAADDKGVCLLEFVDRRMLETEFRDLQRLLKGEFVYGDNHHTKQLRTELQEYFEGKRKSFEVTLNQPGTEFQQTVWASLQHIAFGKTSTYQSQSETINNPKAIRAVATANGYNRISIVVPCHRVIGKDGKLTGYGGGLGRKKWLLDHEQKYSGGVQSLF